jgi:hypothetical protein
VSHFYGDLTGSRGTTTRTGTSNSGISAHPRGWDVGVLVNGQDDGDGDVFHVYATGGSNDPGKRVHVGVDGEPILVPTRRLP